MDIYSKHGIIFSCIVIDLENATLLLIDEHCNKYSCNQHWKCLARVWISLFILDIILWAQLESSLVFHWMYFWLIWMLSSNWIDVDVNVVSTQRCISHTFVLLFGKAEYWYKIYNLVTHTMTMLTKWIM